MSTTDSPPPAPKWTKPFSVVWRARVYFTLAVIFYGLSEIVPKIIVAGGADQSPWQQWIIKAAGSLDKVSYAVFLAGIAYIVISDAFEYLWVNNLQSDSTKAVDKIAASVTDGLHRFTDGLAGMTFESVKVWVEGGSGQISEIRAVALTSLRKCYGHNSNNNELIDFVTGNIMDAWAVPTAQTWETFSLGVTIRPCSVPGHFEWEEKREYHAVSASRSGMLPIRLENSVRVTKEHVLAALDKLDLKIKVDLSQKLDFKAWWEFQRESAKADLERGSLDRSADGITLKYNGLWLSYELSYDHQVTREKTSVSIFESSYISDQDRCYSIAIRHPTRTLRASLSIEGMRWVVKSPVVSAVLYQHDEKVVNIESQHQRTCSVSVPGWTLPGVAVVIEWTPEDGS